MDTQDIVVAAVAAVLGSILGYFVSRGKSSRIEKDLALSRQKVELLEKQNGEWQNAAGGAREYIDQLRNSVSVRDKALASLTASMKAEQKISSERGGEIADIRDEIKQVREGMAALQSENAKLRTSQAEKEQHHKQQIAQFQEQKAALKIEFQNLANEIFAATSTTFKDANRASIDDLLKPFKTQMKDFRERVEDIHHKDTQQQSELKAELKQLQELNRQITEEAHRLATALKGQKKMQGNWGEMILENILDRSGLVQGKDYRREVNFNTEDGRSRPDAIVYLPENKHLVIDAKVSLNAYTRLVNAEDGLERERALKEHAAAVASRIKELGDRSYFDLPGLNSPEMVFMFIPIESAYVEALKADESLFQSALNLNVLVTTPTTLLTSLNIVRQLWRFEDQNKHTAELADKAGKVYEKLNSFLGGMENVGRSLDRAKDSYDRAYGQLYSGRGNLIKQASEFKSLGVSVKTELPAGLVDRAELELTHQREPEGDEAAALAREGNSSVKPVESHDGT